jgi:thymidine kinase
MFALADNLIELKTVCNICSRKATMVVRLNEDGKVITKGSKVQIGGNDVYRVLCRKHFNEATKLLDFSYQQKLFLLSLQKLHFSYYSYL